MGDEEVEGWGMRGWMRGWRDGGGGNGGMEVYLCTCSGKLLVKPFLLPALLPSMLDQGRGHIVVISSLQGKIGLPYRSSCE